MDQVLTTYWNPAWGSISLYGSQEPNGHYLSADTVCCACSSNGGIINGGVCSAGDWSAWGSCSVSCGTGTQTRTRPVHATTNATLCPDTDSQSCWAGSCPCTDKPGWVDKQGNNCSAYVVGQWCNSSQGYGPGWDPKWGTFEDYAVDGVMAPYACCGCGAMTCVSDTMIILDRSGSITQSQWVMIMQYLYIRVNSTKFSGQSGNRIGIIAFSTRCALICPLDYDLARVLACSQSVPFTGGFTFMADAFNLALLYMQQFSDPTRQRNMEIVTDGVSTNPVSVTLATVTTIKEDGILITALGTGPWVDPTELQLMASQPIAEHYASLANYNGLIAVASMLTSGCQPVIPNASQIAWMLWSPSPSPLPEGSPTASSSPLPSHSPSTSPSPSTSASPSPSPSRERFYWAPTASPKASPAASHSPIASASRSPAASHSPAPSTSPSHSASASPSPSPSPERLFWAPTASPKASPAASHSPVASASRSPAPSHSPAASASRSPGASHSPAATPSASPHASPSRSPVATTSPSPHASASQSPAASASRSPAVSHSPAASASRSPDASHSPAASGSWSPEGSHSPAPSASPSPEASPSPAASASASAHASASQSPAASASASPHASDSHSPVASASPSPLATASPSPAASGSPSPLASTSPSPVASNSPSPLSSTSHSPVPTASPSPEPSRSPEPSHSPLASPSPTPVDMCAVQTNKIPTDLKSKDLMSCGSPFVSQSLAPYGCTELQPDFNTWVCNATVPEDVFKHLAACAN